MRRSHGLLVVAVVAGTTLLGAASPIGSADLVQCMDVGGEMRQATIVGTPGNDMLRGTEAVDVIAGLAGDDTLDGGPGDDIICGGEGEDRVLGGAGADILTGDLGDDVIDGSVRFADQHDFVAYDGAPNGVTVDLTVARATGWGSDQVINVNGIAGSNFSDTLTGGRKNDQIIGQKGDDTLNGAGGDDYLSGSEGNDTENGGPGQDTAYYWFAPRAIHASLATGVATGWGRDRLSRIEDLDGSDHPDRLVGDASPNYLRGFSGSDVLIAGAGGDTLVGQRGNDQLDGGPGAHDGGIGGSGRDTCKRIERKSGCERR